MERLSSNQRRAYGALWQLRKEPVVTFDQIAALSGLKRTTAVNATYGLEAMGVVQGVIVKGRRYLVKKLRAPASLK